MKNLLFEIIIVISILALYFSDSEARAEKSFLDPPQLITMPKSKNQYMPEKRKFTGIPSIAVSANGRIWSVWYAGITPKEDLNNYVVVASSTDDGQTWKELFIIDPDGPGPVRAYDPQIWIDPNGKLWIFWAQAAARIKGTWSLVTEGTLAGVWGLTTNNPDSEEPKWDTPRRLTDGVMMGKPIVLSSGEWVLPASMWKLGAGSARMVVSTDEGLSWQVRGSATVPDTVRSYDEHMIVERKDRSLWMLMRTKYGIGSSTSPDRGITWSSVLPSGIEHPAARFFIYRLYSGNLLLVKHGPVSMRTGRSHLMAFLSKDDGYSWSEGLLLDERSGVSYPDAQQTGDGTIFVTYDYSRTGDQNILLTSFSEDDILKNSDIEILRVFNHRKVISKGGPQ